MRKRRSSRLKDQRLAEDVSQMHFLTLFVIEQERMFTWEVRSPSNELIARSKDVYGVFSDAARDGAAELARCMIKRKIAGK